MAASPLHRHHLRDFLASPDAVELSDTDGGRSSERTAAALEEVTSEPPVPIDRSRAFNAEPAENAKVAQKI
jgi:hypothetical protein